MKPDQNKFHDPRRRKWLGGFFTAGIVLGAVFWLGFLAGAVALVWKAVLG